MFKVVLSKAKTVDKKKLAVGAILNAGITVAGGTAFVPNLLTSPTATLKALGFGALFGAANLLIDVYKPQIEFITSAVPEQREVAGENANSSSIQ